MDEHEDILRDSLSGIKKKRTQRIISRFNSDDGLLYDVEESKVYVPGEGIEHVHRIHEKLLSCRHSAGVGLGHIAECGHAVCSICVERFVLECAEYDCFKKLCTVPGCDCCAVFVDGVYYCKRHAVKAKAISLGYFLFGKREVCVDRVKVMCEEYYSRSFQLRGGK